MQNRPDAQNDTEASDANPSLRHLTPAQFMALGGSAVIYIRQIRGKKLSEFMSGPSFADDEEFELVVAADGSPLLVADSREAVAEWLADKDYGVVTLH